MNAQMSPHELPPLIFGRSLPHPILVTKLISAGRKRFKLIAECSLW